MSPHSHLAAQTWSPLATFVVVLTALLYLRAWMHVRHAASLPPTTDHRPPTTDERPPAEAWRPVAFIGGLLTLWIAIGSPLASLDGHLLVVHMGKHLLLMVVAAPLLLVGALPLVRLPFRPWPQAERLIRGLTHPVVCWLSAILAVMVWHVPAVFELGMRSTWWHHVQFTSFLVTGLLFWWPVVQPRQTARWSRWSIPVYLFLATLPCDALSAYLTFCDHVVYASYLDGTPGVHAAALEDQRLAGALMWVTITFAYLAPAVFITMQMLSDEPATIRAMDAPRPASRRAAESV